MKKFLLFSGLMAFAILYSCQKDALPSTELAQSGLTVTARGGGDDSTHIDSTHHHHHHPLDTLGHVPCDSTHQHFPFDSLHHHLDTTGHVPHDSTWTPPGGGGHPHGPHPGGGGNPGDGCHVPPALITIADLPQAAQDWLVANASGATVETVVKFTKQDCSVFYAVKIEGADIVRFDADGNKIN